MYIQHNKVRIFFTQFRMVEMSSVYTFLMMHVSPTSNSNWFFFSYVLFYVYQLTLNVDSTLIILKSDWLLFRFQKKKKKKYTFFIEILCSNRRWRTIRWMFDWHQFDFSVCAFGCCEWKRNERSRQIEIMTSRFK